MVIVRTSWAHFRRILLLGYVVVLLYGSLFPLTRWRVPALSPLHLIFFQGLSASYADILTNLVVYVPLGVLLMHSRSQRRSTAGRIIVATTLGCLVSFGVECVQAYLPSRVPSVLDMLLNTVGTCSGAAIAGMLNRRMRLVMWLASLRETYVRSGDDVNVGLAALVLWASSQLAPFVPSLDFGNIRSGLHPLWVALHQPTLLDTSRAEVYCLTILGLGLLAATLVRSPHRSWPLYALFASAVLLLKVLVVGRDLSLEALVGLGGGLAILLLLQRIRKHTAVRLGGIALIAAVILDESRSEGFGRVAFNWIPFRGQFANSLDGLADILELIWPYVALSYVVALCVRRPSRSSTLIGAFIVFALVLLLEWRQQYLPGRYPDVTDAILAAGGWFVSTLYLARQSISFPSHDRRAFHHALDVQSRSGSATLNGARTSVK